MAHVSSARGFSLLEAIVAAGVLAVALTTLAQLVVVAGRQSVAGRRAATALILAQAKLEELRSLPWRFDPDGSRVSSAALSPSPPNTLSDDVAGWFERLDRFGAPADDQRPLHFGRRWSIAPLAPLDLDGLTLQVCVGHSRPDTLPDACVAAILMRKP
jgi:type II secretory pathway pseudopilin PulG